MTRGRQPLRAIQEAHSLAAQKGVVMETGSREKMPFDLLVFRPGCVEVIKVIRSRCVIGNPQEISLMAGKEITALRKVPLNAVVLRELWVRLPWDRWQYFLVCDDCIVEIRNDGLPVGLPGQDAGVMIPPRPDAIAPRDTKAPPAAFGGGGGICPFLSHVRG